jgi:hypothetical protein
VNKIRLQEEAWFSIHLRRYDASLVNAFKHISPHSYLRKPRRWFFPMSELAAVERALALHGYRLTGIPGEVTDTGISPTGARRSVPWPWPNF